MPDRLPRCLAALSLIAGINVTISLQAGPLLAQEALQPGEAFLTRFSGVTVQGGRKVIDPNGVVGSIVNLRNPAQPPLGQHWLNEPQRQRTTAREVGQIFGIAIDDAAKPNIYLTATSAFGLHRNAGNTDWMTGMWGAGGGPGTVWKLDATNGYKPAAFAEIKLNGRSNTGAALGNISYDRWNKQLFVSDLETGMIHRLSTTDGRDLGRFDHGIEGRKRFLDPETGNALNLPTVAFQARGGAQIKDCAAGPFANSPNCWNYADFRRRVWGLGVRKSNDTSEVRLYYSVWSSQGFAAAAFSKAAADEKRNSVWSVALDSHGAFLKDSVRREFYLPDFFINPSQIASHGRSHPVTDIAFPRCSQRKVMLVAERGGVRNLGLEAEAPFARPHEARVLRFESDGAGVWRSAARYDVGFYDRKNHSAPYIRSNGCGGVDFGYGYQKEWSADEKKPDAFVWMTGDALCSPHGPCNVPEIRQRTDGSYVQGAEGTPQDATADILPAGALQPSPQAVAAQQPVGPSQSYFFDADINISPDGSADMASLLQNHNSMMGDIEIHQICDGDDANDSPPQVADGAPQPPIVEDPPGVSQPPPVAQPPIDEGPDLAVDKTGPAQCTEGDQCQFTITVTNNGPGTWSGPLRQLDTLPQGAILVGYGPQPNWMCNQGSGTQNVVCDSQWTTLAPGDATQLDISVLVPAGSAGQTLRNCVEQVWLPSSDPLDPAVVQSIEQSLGAQGYVTGPVDGFLDVVTRAAIEQYQYDNGFVQTGLPDDVLIAALFPANAGLPGDGDPTNDADCHDVAIVPPPITASPTTADLEVRKLQMTGQCRPGELCTFQLIFLNRGPADWMGRLEVSDLLPAGATLVRPAAGCVQTGRTVRCRYPRRLTLPPNVPGRVNMTIRLPVSLRQPVRNCATVTGINGTPDPNANNNRHCIPVRIAPPTPDLAVHKVQTSRNCRAGGTCDFDLWFINRGPGMWTRSIRIADRLPKGVVFDSVSADWKCQQRSRNLSCWRQPVQLRPGRAVRASVRLSLPADMRNGAQNCLRIPRLAGIPRDLVPDNNQHCIPVSLQPDQPKALAPVPDFGVTKRQIGTCEPGGICTFGLRFTNNGPGTWSGRPEVTDLMPSVATSVASWSPTSWSLTPGGVFAHEEITLPSGGFVDLKVGLQMPDAIASDGALENCAVIRPETFAASDKDPSNNRHCIPVSLTKPEAPKPEQTPRHTVDVAIRKMLAPYNPAGSEGGCETGCIVRIEITNAGSTTWSGPLAVRDLSLPPGTKLVRGMALSMAQPGWTCTPAGRCDIGSVTLAPGDKTELDFYVALSVVPPGHWRNCAELIGLQDANPKNNRHCIDIPTQETANPEPEPEPTKPGNIAVQKEQLGQCRPGTTCVFALRFQNAGQSVWQGRPRLSDVTTAGAARVVSWAPQTWQCQTKAHSTNCRHEQIALRPGEVSTLNLTVQMPASLGAGAQNCVIRLGDPDVNPSDDRQCIPIRVAPEPGFTPKPPRIVTPKPPREPRPPVIRTQCPRGMYRRGRRCVEVARSCPKGTYRRGNRCVRKVSRKCPKGTFRRGNRCYRVVNRGCPRGTIRRGRKCYVPRSVCPRGMSRIGNICVNIPGVIGTIGTMIGRQPQGRRHREE